MAGANNAQMKSQGFKKAQIVAMRAASPGPITLAKAERAKVSPPAGWQAAVARSRGKGGLQKTAAAQMQKRAAAPPGWQSAARKAAVAKGAPGWNAAAKKAAGAEAGAPGWKAAADRAAAKKGAPMVAAPAPAPATAPAAKPKRKPSGDWWLPKTARRF